MKAIQLFVFILVGSILISCGQKEASLLITVSNSLDLPREFETVEISKADFPQKDLSTLGIKNVKTNKVLASQLVDNDGDGTMDVLLFQPSLKANASETYELIKRTDNKTDTGEKICYSRFVPERTDDYAWENNMVAFRTYGPNAQYRFENKLKEGTLSSGIDAWLKRVDYSIIDSWYKKYTEKTGTYHEDTGEGLDDFHVGTSRGVGGIAYKKDSTFYISKNFINYKTLTNGPIRTSFILDYGTWDADGNSITESKIISLDYGNNLSKFEINLTGVDTISAGLTLHKNDGVVTSHLDETWLNYWQPHGDSELGTAIVASKKYYIDNEKFVTEIKDLSNAFMHLKVIEGKAIYYAGFTWKKSNQFKSQQAWEQYLSDFSKKLEAPLEIKIVKE